MEQRDEHTAETPAETPADATPPTLAEYLRAHNVRSPLNDGLDWHAADYWYDAEREREWE